ncbi:MAG TPA: hypothetical protein VHJ54_10935 [Solirubrobacterales bacterium]|jgi:hypothetical protein|nr:hypothetical protein [Solirubrobacterales bacterium]
MGRLGRLIDWIDAKVDRPADQSVLRGERNPGSEAMIATDDPDQAQAAAETVRRTRDRRRWRWLYLGRR